MYITTAEKSWWYNSSTFASMHFLLGDLSEVFNNQVSHPEVHVSYHSTIAHMPREIYVILQHES